MIQSLNTLRALAALIVVITHYSKSTGLFNGFVGRGSGQMGVMLFFIISGFLMSYLYLENMKPFSSQEVKKFIVSRASRVLPLFLLLVIISYFLKQVYEINILYNIPDISSLISHLLLLNGVSVLWTIPPEIHFYLYFIFLWYLYAIKKGLMLVVLVLSFIVVHYFDYPRFYGEFLNLKYDFSFLRALPYFYVGMGFGILYRNWVCPENMQSAWYLTSLIILPLLFPDVFEYIFKFRHGLWQSVYVLALISLVFFCCVFLTPKNNIFIANHIGDFLGKISYSIYLLHMPVLKYFKQIGKSNPELYLFMYLACTILVALISYLVIEKPLRSFLKNKFKNKNKNDRT